MKKIYTLFIGLSAASLAVAQVAMPHNGAPSKLTSVNHLKNNAVLPSPSSVATTMYIDYSGANQDDGYFVWRFSDSYTGLDTAFNYIGVGMNEVAGYTDPANPTTTFLDWNGLGYPNAWPSNQIVTIDSIYILWTQEHNSSVANYDKFNMKLVNLLGTGAPGTTVLWQKKDSTNVTLSPGGNWVGTGAVFQTGYACGYTSTYNQKLGLVFEYFDPTHLDTASLLIGYKCSSGCSSGSPIPFVSTYPKTWGSYPPFIPAISQTANWTSGPNPAACQNAEIWCKVSTTLSGIDELTNGSLKLSQNMPNPFNGTTAIAYELTKASDNVSLSVYDVTGKQVMNIAQGKQSLGKHTIQLDAPSLEAGIYYYTLSTNDGSRLTKKMIVTK